MLHALPSAPRGGLGLTRSFTCLAAIAAAVFTAVVLAVPVAANESATIARRYDDGLDSRLSAVKLGEAARGLGYGTTIASSGRTANNAFLDGSRSAVFGLFGHANAGIFQTNEGSTDNEDDVLAAGVLTDAVSSFANVRFFSEYIPYVEVDDMRLLVLAGCYTALSSNSWGDFQDVSRSRGVDSVVTFPGLVYFPSTAPGTALSQTNYSGNYYWNRFSYYVRNGAAVATALANAHTDLVNKEGNGGGWGRWQITGSVPNPGQVRVSPAGWGEPFTSQPTAQTGVAAYSSLDELTPVSSTELSSPAGPTTAVTTQEGVIYRLRADGRLYDVAAPTASAGQIQLSMDDAQAAALAFAERYAAEFDASWQLVEAATASHVQGDTIAQFQWRPVAAQLPGPAQVTVEIDRRTGAVTYFSATRGPATTAAFFITQAEAIAKARAVVGNDEGVATATGDTWQTSRWIVTIDRGLSGRSEAQVPDVDRIEIDARTGEVLSQITA